MSNSQSYDQFEAAFYEKFNEHINSLNDNSFYMNKAEYQEIINEVQEAKKAFSQNQKLTDVQKRRLRRFDIAFDKLVAKNVSKKARATIGNFAHFFEL